MREDDEVNESVRDVTEQHHGGSGGGEILGDYMESDVCIVGGSCTLKFAFLLK